MLWKSVFVSVFLALFSVVAAAPQFLGFGGVVGKNLTPRGGSTFPKWARGNWAANSGRGIVRDYGVSGATAAHLVARSSYGR